MNGKRKLVRVRDIMKTEFDLVDGMATVAEALQQARHPDTKCLIVRKRHKDDEFGIVLYSDIAKRVLARDRAPERVNVYEIMSKPVVGVSPGMDIRYCARLFENFGLARAPVIEHDEVIGIVGYTDMVLEGMLARFESA
ncbi:MAG: CBS domain-containing protein [Gammaproteobacteria bacterium]|nr:MAG: CBS domain-containing protein [Gammaproteobacteria bacterium]